MRRIFWTVLLGGIGLTQIGCFLPIYPSDPNRRVAVLMHQSEDLRQISYEWSRIWFTDQPSHLTPNRIDGGIQ